MSQINIKGTPDGLIICIKTNKVFEKTKIELKDKLEAAREFFNGARYNFYSEGHLQAEELAQLVEICSEKGMTYDTNISLPPSSSQKKESESSTHLPPKSSSNIFHRNIRSGQKIVSPSDIVIVGNVNPGAELVAGGSIIVMGKLGGMAHAGAEGDKSATIMAQEMEPTQVRISDIVACRPDSDRPTSGYPEIAYVSDDKIEIDKLKSKLDKNGVIASA